jgi:chromate reductase
MNSSTPARRVGVIVGSLRQQSINKRLALAIEKLAPPQLQFSHVTIGDLPLMNQDLEKALQACDALLIITPEYNRSIPGPLKNAIDWASRPRGQNSVAGKPAAIGGSSPGPLSTAAAQQHLRNVLSVLDVHVMSQPELYLHFTPELIAEDGTVSADSTRQFLERYAAAFAAWVERFKA